MPSYIQVLHRKLTSLCRKCAVIFKKCEVLYKKGAVIFKKCAVLCKNCIVLWKNCTESLAAYFILYKAWFFLDLLFLMLLYRPAILSYSENITRYLEFFLENGKPPWTLLPIMVLPVTGSIFTRCVSGVKCFNLLTTNVPIICSANQLTGFYMTETLVVKRLMDSIFCLALLVYLVYI